MTVNPSFLAYASVSRLSSRQKEDVSCNKATEIKNAYKINPENPVILCEIFGV
jgi:hypothetical protein